MSQELSVLYKTKIILQTGDCSHLLKSLALSAALPHTVFHVRKRKHNVILQEKGDETHCLQHNKKEHKHQNQILNLSSKLHSTWGNGPISLNLGVLVNKMGIKANVQGYCNDQFSSVTQSRLTLCDPMSRSTPGLPVHHQLPESTQTHVHESVMPSNHLILCRPRLLLPSIFPSITRV